MQEQRDQISARAYALWEAEGKPDGRALSHWLAAERECGAETIEKSTVRAAAAPVATRRATRKK